jgi:hypothetical protein
MEGRACSKMQLNTNGSGRIISRQPHVPEVVRIDQRVCPGSCAPDGFKRDGRRSNQRKPLPKRDPAALPKGDPADVGVQVGRGHRAQAVGCSSETLSASFSPSWHLPSLRRPRHSTMCIGDRVKGRKSNGTPLVMVQSSSYAAANCATDCLRGPVRSGNIC